LGFIAAVHGILIRELNRDLYEINIIVSVREKKGFPMDIKFIHAGNPVVVERRFD